MRTRIKTVLALALTLSATTSCAKTSKDRLQGRWLGGGIENVPTAEIPRAMGWVKGTAMEFSGSKVTVTIPAESPRAGQFKVTKTEGDMVTVSFLRDEGSRDEAQFRFVGEEMLRWSIGEGRDILLRKAKD